MANFCDFLKLTVYVSWYRNGRPNHKIIRNCFSFLPAPSQCFYFRFSKRLQDLFQKNVLFILRQNNPRKKVPQFDEKNKWINYYVKLMFDLTSFFTYLIHKIIFVKFLAKIIYRFFQRWMLPINSFHENKLLKNNLCNFILFHNKYSVKFLT